MIVQLHSESKNRIRLFLEKPSRYAGQGIIIQKRRLYNYLCCHKRLWGWFCGFIRYLRKDSASM